MTNDEGLDRMMSDSQPCNNTDREIWRGPDEGCGSYYADSLFITEYGALGINCGGTVRVRSIRGWHALAGGALVYDKSSRTIKTDNPDKIDPTARGDIIAEKVRAWYEANRERWRDRHNPLGLFGTPDRAGVHADNFMIRLINAVAKADAETPR